MYKIHQPIKDNTIYQNNPDLNAGADPIIELFKYSKGEIISSQAFEINEWPTSTNSRIIMQFKDIEYNALHDYILQLHICHISNLISKEIDIEIMPLTQEWVEGNGNKNDSPSIKTGSNWNSSGIINWNNTYYDDSTKVEYTLNMNNDSFEININPLIEYWDSNPNFGFIIKYSDIVEDSDVHGGRLSFYGTDTHTVWGPLLVELIPSTDVYIGEFEPSLEVPADQIECKILNFKSTYLLNSNTKLYIKLIDIFKEKTYLEINNQINEDIILDDNSTFSIVDSYSERVMVPYSPKNNIMKSDRGYFIQLNLDNFYPKRFYKIIFKLIDNNGNIYIKDYDYNFKVE